eukprot:scaffold337_cov393-Prasinococcus_capsulatus_cf.AAC.12
MGSSSHGLWAAAPASGAHRPVRRPARALLGRGGDLIGVRSVLLDRIGPNPPSPPAAEPTAAPTGPRHPRRFVEAGDDDDDASQPHTHAGGRRRWQRRARDPFVVPSWATRRRSRATLPSLAVELALSGGHVPGPPTARLARPGYVRIAVAVVTSAQCQRGVAWRTSVGAHPFPVVRKGRGWTSSAAVPRGARKLS